MTMGKEPFRQYRDDEERKKDNRVTFTVSLNKEEYARLQEDKKFIEQSRDSSALKQMAAIGSVVIREGFSGKLIQTLFINKRRNKRIGIAEFE